MKDKYKKIAVFILILVAVFGGLNIYLNSKKESVKINKTFNRAIAIKGSKLGNEVTIDIDGKLSDTHFVYRYLKYSKELKGTVVLNNEKYNIVASSSIKNKTFEGVLIKDNNTLVSDFSIVISEDFSKICIYKGDYIIASPADTLEDVDNIYKEIVDIPIN
ncbi:MAG: hypothetical protein RSD77_07645 [Romboutsia sp.]